MIENDCFYTMHRASELLGVSRPKLFKFLRRYGIIDGTKPRQEFVLMGYLNYRLMTVQNGKFRKVVFVSFLSGKGIKWLKKVMRLLGTENINEWV